MASSAEGVGPEPARRTRTRARGSAPRSFPQTTAAGAAGTHLVKASPRSITTAVFSPPLPRPSYSGMAAGRAVGRQARTRGPGLLSSEGRGGGGAGRRRRRGPRVAAARRTRAVPGWASSASDPHLAGGPVRGTKEEEMRLPSVAGTRGRVEPRKSGAPATPSGAGPPRVLPAGHALRGRWGGGFLGKSVARWLRS